MEKATDAAVMTWFCNKPSC